MADVVSPEVRSRMMSGIRGSNTKPEIALRSGLHRLGLRFTLRSKLPGKPDIVLPRHKVAVFFHGCFWHGHEGCPLFKIPGTRPEFWKAKIDGNRSRDERVKAELLAAGWRVATVRECAIRGKEKRPIEAVCGALAEWVRTGQGRSLEMAAMDRLSPLA
jgi:DNA mismatch endonuclease, patch repair protein